MKELNTLEERTSGCKNFEELHIVYSKDEKHNISKDTTQHTQTHTKTHFVVIHRYE